MKHRRSKIRIAIHKKSGLSLILLFAILALPWSMAQACLSNVATETACCRVMRSACHLSHSPNPCCLRNAPVPAPGTLPMPAEKASVHAPVFAVACMLPAAFPDLQGPSAFHSRTPLGGHSPPGDGRIFLMHSALLI